MAVAACSEDPRFKPVSENELKDIDYEVSVLSAPEQISDWQKIELGKQGVIVRKGFHSGVFLPQVAEETGWNLEQFLSELCAQKAGLPPDSYKTDPTVELEVFTAQIISEN
jgi:AmmeMemoRadiSam system protein A